MERRLRKQRGRPVGGAGVSLGILLIVVLIAVAFVLSRTVL
jgi:hypothetical protein